MGFADPAESLCPACRQWESRHLGGCRRHSANVADLLLVTQVKVRSTPCLEGGRGRPVCSSRPRGNSDSHIETWFASNSTALPDSMLHAMTGPTLDAGSRLATPSWKGRGMSLWAGRNVDDTDLRSASSTQRGGSERGTVLLTLRYR